MLSQNRGSSLLCLFDMLKTSWLNVSSIWFSSYPQLSIFTDVWLVLVIDCSIFYGVIRVVNYMCSSSSPSHSKTVRIAFGWIHAIS